MESTASRRVERTRQSRRLLLEAAAELFAEKGYRQTSFVDIADRAAISRGSIPWHFGNKLGLLEAVVDDRLRTVLGRFDQPAGEFDDPLAQVMDFIRLPETRLFITLLAEAVEVDSPIREHYARLHAALREGVRDRIPAAALPPDVEPGAMAVLLVGVVIGIHAQWRVDPDAVDLDAVRVAVLALLRSHLGRS